MLKLAKRSVKNQLMLTVKVRKLLRRLGFKLLVMLVNKKDNSPYK